MMIIDGKKEAEILRQEIKKEIESLKLKNNKVPGLTVILIGDFAPSQIYVKNKEKSAKEVGINSNVVRYSKEVKEEEVLKKIEDLNNDIDVSGILVQLPLPPQINKEKIINAVSPRKDVDGFNSKNIGLLAIGRPKVIPCTPLGCYKMLESILDLEGKKVIILGRSNIVGKPLSFLLTNKNATVTLAHSKSKNLKDLCLSSDIIIAAIGKPNFVKKEWVKEKAVIIDVGINVIEDKNGLRKIVGDVDYGDVIKKVSFISPVPGGVGPMTIHCLLLNTFLLTTN